MDDIQAVDIHTGQPFHHVVIAVHDFLVLQVFGSDGTVFGTDLLFADLVHSAIDSIKEAFGKVGASAEKLHFLANAHGRDAAGDGIVISQIFPHQVIIFILDGGGLNRGLGAETFEILRKLYGPQHGQVWFRCSSQCGQGMQETEGHLGY